MPSPERPSTRRRLVTAWLPAVVYMGLIWTVSSMPVRAPSVPAFLSDKSLHFMEFAVLGFLLGHAALRTWPRHARWRAGGVALLIAVAWGVLDEVHQAFVPGRTPDVMDVAADALGASFGVSVRILFGLLKPREVEDERWR